MKPRFAVITSFHKEGLEKYGNRFLETFFEFWPAEVPLRVYAEDCWPEIPPEHQNRLEILDLHSQTPELVEFKKKFSMIPKCNGITSTGYNYRYDAVRFANKSFAVMHAAKTLETDYLIWCDADVVTHKKIPMSFLNMLTPKWADICWLDRHKMYPECGFYIIRMSNPSIKVLMEYWRQLYVSEDIFKHCSEWHDSWVFQQLVLTGVKLNMVKVNSISGGGFKTEHPFINGPLGDYMDHMKGDRKELGRSPSSDKTIGAKRGYWNA